ncbi:hypothetical protein ACVXZY_01410 [Staphylococcus aureus]
MHNVLSVTHGFLPPHPDRSGKKLKANVGNVLLYSDLLPLQFVTLIAAYI